MTSISPVSRNDLTQRRRKLRSQRRARFFQASWRNLAVTGLAVGALWVATLPAWVIRKPEQVTIKGNQFISAQTIRTLLPIAYPQSLLKIQPQTIADNLKSKVPIAEATVDRQLFPPSLTVRIQERVPVAVAAPAMMPAGSAPQAMQPGAPQTGLSRSELSQAGLLDDSGMWIPLESYVALNQRFKLPALKVTGNPEQYRPYWSKLYPMIRQSPVRVLEVNWDDPSNLILKTDLGLVHFGAFGENFPNQLRALDRMRRFPSQVNPGQIAYLDLTNPDSPTIQMNTFKSPVKLGTP